MQVQHPKIFHILENNIESDYMNHTLDISFHFFIVRLIFRGYKDFKLFLLLIF